MKKVLITGANGFVGQHLTLFLAKQGFEVIATGRGECRLPTKGTLSYAQADLAIKDEVSRMLANYRPEIIIHSAAMSKPDECDQCRDACIRTNVQATQNLLAFGAERFVYFSTDFIFGENGPHPEDAPAGPLNFYGQSKLLAEAEVKQSGLTYTIVRPAFVYGPVWEGLKPNFIYWVKNSLEQGKPIKVVSDQQRTPTFVGDICAGVLSILQKEASGDYHLAGQEIMSPYQMAVTTADTLNLDAGLIENVTSATFPEPVKRAQRSGLIVNKAVHDLGFKPITFSQGIAETFGLL